MPLNIGRRHNTATNLRIAKILTGKRGLYASPELDVDVQAENGVMAGDTAIAVEQDAAALVTGDYRSDDRPFMENDDPTKNPTDELIKIIFNKMGGLRMTDSAKEKIQKLKQ